jgi:Zn-dependent protease/CBS domain-containing protein
MKQGFKLARVFGVQINADWSLLLMALLLTTSLSAAMATWHPDWPLSVTWIVALLGAVLFICSIALHELAHALVGRASGIPVSHITLFIFGGIANIEREPPTPAAELKMAIVGPLTSLAIGFLSGLALGAAVQPGVMDDPEQLISTLGPALTLLAWLGPLNFALGLFNLIPGFPLDGGRVLRALIWWASKDFKKATNIAAAFGQTVGAVLCIMGVAMAFGLAIPFFGVGFGPGLWLVVLGWFLGRAATGARRDLVLTEKLGSVPVSLVMRATPMTVEPTTLVRRLVDDVFPNVDAQTVAVVKNDHFEGLVSRLEVKRIPENRWEGTLVSQIMKPIDSVATVDPKNDAKKALEQLEREGVSELPVVSGGRLMGTIGYREITRWLSTEASHPRA